VLKRRFHFFSCRKSIFYIHRCLFVLIFKRQHTILSAYHMIKYLSQTFSSSRHRAGITLSVLIFSIQKLAFFLVLFSIFGTQVEAQPVANWNAQWITANKNLNQANTWMAFRKDFAIARVPLKAITRIAADSKYWLYMNGKMIVFEGGLKRGPNPTDGYYDEIDIAPYLKSGNNTIAVLTCYFGKDGFSHKSSGKAALLVDCTTDEFKLVSNEQWMAAVVQAYQTCPLPLPNYRLSESSISFDANLAVAGWEQPGNSTAWMEKALLAGKPGDAPWGNLAKRPIPFWKDSGLKDYLKVERHGDTMVCKLPYNAQITPYLSVRAAGKQTIELFTDNYSRYNGGTVNIRAAYVTRPGEQNYESFGWMNGHTVYYLIPAGIEVLALKYRETGFDTSIDGSFECADTLLNKLWQKASRTLYVTMRDNYMDCPDRERAQWTGDATIELGESFYTLSRTSDLISRKWLHEVVDWQRANGSMIAPVPQGNYAAELPDQILATIGFFGVWNYYLNTADLQTLADVYPAAKKYLALWKLNGDGTVQIRKGDWTWGDWGDNKDMLLLYNLWYYLAIKGQYHAAIALNKTTDTAAYGSFMRRFQSRFNERFWNQDITAYRDPAYKGKTDDRVQALAIVAGIADKYRAQSMLPVFSREIHASPYMEKYVFEAMMQMGYPQQAIARQESRYLAMLNDTRFTTLFEGWGVGTEGFGGGTVNHAWSGGGLTILGKYVCGIAPVEPGFKKFEIMPNPGDLKYASITVPSIMGVIKSSFKNSSEGFELICQVPANTSAIGGIPSKKYAAISINGETVWQNGSYTAAAAMYHPSFTGGHISFELPAGMYNIKAIY
jgi:hypothetical protein